MACDPRPRALAHVDPDVESVGVHRPLQDLDTEVGQFEKLGPLLGAPAGESRGVAAGNHHQMAVVVGVSVHDDEVMLAPVEDQILSVPVLIDLLAEYAAARLVTEDVLHPPGCP